MTRTHSNTDEHCCRSTTLTRLYEENRNVRRRLTLNCYELQIVIHLEFPNTKSRILRPTSVFQDQNQDHVVHTTVKAWPWHLISDLFRVFVKLEKVYNWPVVTLMTLKWARNQNLATVFIGIIFIFPQWYEPVDKPCRRKGSLFSFDALLVHYPFTYWLTGIHSILSQYGARWLPHSVILSVSIFTVVLHFSFTRCISMDRTIWE